MAQAPQPFGGLPYSYDDEGNLDISVALGPLSEMLIENRITVNDAVAILDSKGRNADQIADYLNSVGEVDVASEAAKALGLTAQNLSGVATAGVYDATSLQADAVANALNSIEAMITASYGQQSQALVDIQNAVLGSSYQSYLATLGVRDKEQQTVLDYLEAQSDRNEQLAQDLEEEVTGFLSKVGEGLDTQAKALDATIKAEIDPVIEAVQQVTDSVIDQATGFATAIREVIPNLGTTVVDGLASVGESVGETVKDAAASVFSSFFLEISEDARNRIDPIITMFEEELTGATELESLTAPGALPIAAIGGLIAGIALPMIVSSVASTALSPFAEKMRQRMNSIARPALLTPTEAAAAEDRGFLEGPWRDYVLDRHGLPDTMQEAVIELAKVRPDIGSLIRWDAREIIEDAIAIEEAQKVGWDAETYQRFKDEYYGPPPIGDLIRMVVRDTFEPDVVQAGKLSEGFDTFPIKTAEQVGLTPYWAEKYWQAHWELPSLQQGFEMLHRDEITRDELLALFKAADLAPGYWEPMEAISYRPFTRVDVRRMNAFGILDEQGVLRAYKDIGYNEEKAQALTDFTIAYNESTKKGEKSRERDLSKSDVIGMYNDGVLDAQVTRDYLVQLGYSEDEASVLIEREDIQEMRRERKADISNIIDQAKIKALTYEEAQDRLAALDLTRTETNKALADLARVSQTRTRTPSKTDLDEWLGLALITPGDYAEELRTLGYAERYVQLYVEATTAEAEADILAGEERAAKRREPRSVSKGNLDSLFQAEIIDVDDYTAGLVSLGYRDRDIANLLEQQTVKLEERRLEERERLARGEEAAVTERLPSRSLLGKLYLKELISIEAYRDGLTMLGFSPDNVELLAKLIGAKAEEDAGQQAGVTG